MSQFKKSLYIFGKLTGMGWFVVALVIASAFIGKLIGDRVGFPVFFTFLGTLVGATISGLGIKIAIRNVRNMDKK